MSQGSVRSLFIYLIFFQVYNDTVSVGLIRVYILLYYQVGS